MDRRYKNGIKEDEFSIYHMSRERIKAKNLGSGGARKSYEMKVICTTRYWLD